MNHALGVAWIPLVLGSSEGNTWVCPELPAVEVFCVIREGQQRCGLSLPVPWQLVIAFHYKEHT